MVNKLRMDNTLFGIPLAFWGVGCLMIAVVYYQIWPMPNPKRIQPRTTWQHVVLRYFHSLVWVLLAAGCFLGGFGYGMVGLVLASLSVPTYIVFLVMLLQDRQRELTAQSEARKKKSESVSSDGPPAQITHEG